MASSTAFKAFKSSALISWRSMGTLQKTIGKCIEKSGIGLHSGKLTTVKIWPELAGKGRYFDVGSSTIQASIDFVQQESPLCTTLSKDGFAVRTVEHLLSALEATGVDNCCIQITPSAPHDGVVELPILDGSAREWVEAIKHAGLESATDENGNNCEKMAPFVEEPVHVRRNDSFVAAFPSTEIHITCGINFPKVEQLRDMGLIKGGSLENAIVCSASEGWLNPPLRFHDEPCRHKVLDLIGDLSMLARSGSQGLPVAHIVACKAGHAMHADLVRCLAKLG
ncbi:hypothetical protein Cgig2_031763 [Carnegiea gigantea]|uniref:UDP-3-O-acyl-N-acetylglucosamine deacetylase n=1 Tax=Carnegiea gigantea TaxID=171969 RepID=A0A9Q1KQ99_9CARY|nr:hypothetical protein Cgig2_031763 [Carnegiea gigantea]